MGPNSSIAGQHFRSICHSGINYHRRWKLGNAVRIPVINRMRFTRRAENTSKYIALSDTTPEFSLRSLTYLFLSHRFVSNAQLNT